MSDQERVAIIIDSLDHWPRELGPELDEVIRRKLADMADKHIAKLFDGLFPPPDLDAWKSSCRRWPPGNYGYGGRSGGIRVNGA